MNGGLDPKLNQAQYFSVEYKNAEIKQTRIIKVLKEENSSVRLTPHQIETAIKAKTSILQANNRVFRWDSLNSELAPTSEQQKATSIAESTLGKNENISVTENSQLQNIITDTDITNLSKASGSQSWLSWFLSFFNFFSTRESKEISALFDMNKNDNFVNTLEIFQKLIPDEDTTLKTKISDAIANYTEFKQHPNKTDQGISNSYESNIIEKIKNFNVNQEYIIPISTTLNNNEIPSFLIIKKQDTGTDREPRYSVKKLGLIKNDSPSVDKVQMVRSFVCYEDRLKTILYHALSKKIYGDPGFFTGLDHQLNELLNPCNEDIFEIHPTSTAEQKTAYATPNKDPLSLCFLLAKQSINPLPSENEPKAALESLSQENKSSGLKTSNKSDILCILVAELAKQFINSSSSLSRTIADKIALQLDAQLTSAQFELSEIYGEEFAKVFIDEIREKVDERISSAKLSNNNEASITHTNLASRVLNETVADGNCGPDALRDQLEQRGAGVYPISYLRKLAASYLRKNKENIIQDTTKYNQILGALIGAGINTTSYVDKRELIEAYAKLIEKDKAWVDSAFFMAIAPELNRDIVILQKKQNVTSLTSIGDCEVIQIVYSNQQQKTASIQSVSQSEALFIFYNYIEGMGGDHYKSINLKCAGFEDFIKNNNKYFSSIK